VEGKALGGDLKKPKKKGAPSSSPTKRVRRRPTLVMAFWQQAELVPT
jgi:hypothetical protein